MKTTLKKISGLFLIGLFALVACKEAKDKINNSKEEKIVMSKATINKNLLIGSWLDQSESKLHFSILENGIARSDNMTTLLYEKWKLDGTKLVLTAKGIGNGSSSIDNEVYEINLLTEDRMILKNGDYSFEFIKKK